MQPETPRRLVLAATLVAIAIAVVWLENLGTPSTVPPAPADLPKSEADLQGAPNFAGATGWLNTPDGAPVDLLGLRGRVVLVDFWTYSCINCIHTLPHVTRLSDTYEPYGLTVIGVHTPEFGFERDPANVRKAIAEHGIHYAVPQDNDDSIWNAYHNRGWPAHYLIDQYGKVRFTHLGEGGYAEAEMQVRQLLAEAGHGNLPTPIESGAEGGGGAHTPELYAAGGRSVLANPEGYHSGTNVTYARPATVTPDRIYLVGTWHNGDQQLTAQGAASILVQFSGAGGNIVLDGVTGCLPIQFDGQPVTQALAGPDVDVARGCLRVAGADSYDFFAGANGTHTAEIQVPAGLQLYTFDFTGGP